VGWREIASPSAFGGAEEKPQSWESFVADHFQFKSFI
jgi:hypothetical protein